MGGVAIYSARMVSGGCGHIQCQDGQWEVWPYTVPECQNYTIIVSAEDSQSL